MDTFLMFVSAAATGACMALVLAAVLLRKSARPTSGPTGEGTTFKEIRAGAFVLVDGKGKDRAMLYATQDGAKLVLSDENGKPRAMLFQEKDGARLVLVYRQP